MNKKFNLVMGTVLLVLSMISGSRMVNLAANTTPGVVLSVEPSVKKVDLGESFIVAVGIADVRDLNKWEIQIGWDAAVIELDLSDANMVEEGSFLKSVGATKFEVSSYKSGSGVLSRITCCFLQAKGASGSGTLLKLHLKAVGEGETSITISDSELYDFMLRSIFHDCNSGRVSVESVLRDIAVVSFENQSSFVLGQSTQLDVTVENKGTVDEIDVKVSIYVNGSVVNSTTISELTVSHRKLCSFSWTPSSKGMYNITAYATPVAGEANTTNNQKTLTVEVDLHDVGVMFEPELPENVVFGKSLWLNTTVTNLGSTNEIDVKVSIYVNGSVVNSTTLLQLEPGDQDQLCFNWSASAEGTYNITSCVCPVAGEKNIYNNLQTITVHVAVPSESPQLLIVADDDGDWHEFGTSLAEFEHALTTVGYECDVWKESENGNPSLDKLLEYEIVAWTVGDYCNLAVDRTDASTLKNYILQGGNLLIEGQFIALENPSFKTDFCKSVLHVIYEGSFITVSPATGLLVTRPDNIITIGLPSNMSWQCANNGHDLTSPAYGAYDVTRFVGINSSAINVFDGTQNGQGSVVYFSFSLRWLSKEWRNILAQNCIEWFEREGVSVVASRIIHAHENTICFVYANPESLNGGPYIPEGSVIYSLCTNTQKQLVDSFEELPQFLEMKDSVLALFGSPEYNSIVRYYESETDLTPIKYFNSDHYMFLNQAGTVLCSLSVEDVTSGRNDSFVIYVFRDREVNNTYLVVYGFDWRGCWAAEIYYSQVISCNLPVYSKSYYVFSWADNNGNGVPEIPEINEESSG